MATSQEQQDQPKIWIGTGWKMNKTLTEARLFANSLVDDGRRVGKRIQRFVLPPFTLLREMKAMLSTTDVLIGAQNVHWEDHGPWTGEISAPMLADCGIALVEIGHSERRAHFGETNDRVGLKVAAALRHGLMPLICIGETSDEIDRADEVLDHQVRSALAHAPKNADVLFAYEPVWAIGELGSAAEPEYANLRQARVKSLAEILLEKPTRCLYGGSVNANNCAGFIAQPMIDGLFIGRAAWDASGYLEILRRCAAEL